MINQLLNQTQTEIKAAADIRRRCAQIVAQLEKIATSPNGAFAEPSAVFLHLVIARHDLEAAIAVMVQTYCKQWLIEGRNR